MADLPLPVLADDQIKGGLLLLVEGGSWADLRDFLPQNEQEVR